MKRCRHTPQQVIHKVVKNEKLFGQDKDLKEVCRYLEITESTWNRWRNQYGRMKADDAKKLKELERENARLKRIVVDRALGIDMVKELNRGKLLTRTAAGRPSGPRPNGFGSPNGGHVGWCVRPAPHSASPHSSHR